MNHKETFVFNTERHLIALTGLKARNLTEMLSILREVSGSSIFYHTHQQYLSHHFKKPEFYNDFALWISEALQEEALAEKLAAIDLLNFSSIRQLREAIIRQIEVFLNENGGRLRECPSGDEFHFCKSKSFIMPTGIVARDISDFLNKLPSVTADSLYFHFFEARLRLERLTNDFSLWIKDRGEGALAAQIDQLNPYAMTLDELRQEIIELGLRHLGS